MSLTADDVKKIAHLARISMSSEDIAFYTPQLSNILHFVEQMSSIDTQHIEPLANPLDLTQRTRPDKVTEKDQRAAFQAIAPKVEAGLYLVPKVIEGE
jgi:aspartyl-tRNA(Asn)/glutamyl-tRNA(Gln) amidotransferase subunit C